MPKMYTYYPINSVRYRQVTIEKSSDNLITNMKNRIKNLI